MINKNSSSIFSIGFADNPMVIKAEVQSGTFPTGSTFRQVCLVLTFSASGKSYKFSQESDNGETVTFNVASAFRAELRDTYMRNPQFPSSSFEALLCDHAAAVVTAHGEYVKNGEILQTQSYDFYPSSAPLYGIPGGLSEMTRLRLGASDPVFILLPSGDSEEETPPLLPYLTMKPKTGEVINQGDLLCVHVFDEESYQVESYFSHADTLGPVAVPEPTTVPEASPSVSPSPSGRTVFVENNPDRHEFVFLSRLCLFETASALTRESLSYDVETEEKTIVNTPSFLPKVTLMTTHSDLRPEWKMSSGPVTREWAEWWTTEFLAAKRHWLRQPDGSLLPVTITPDGETTTIYDRSKQELISINFTAKSGITN